MTYVASCSHTLAPACTRQLVTNGTVGHGERKLRSMARVARRPLLPTDVQLEALVLITSVIGKNQCCTNKV